MLNLIEISREVDYCVHSVRETCLPTLQHSKSIFCVSRSKNKLNKWGTVNSVVMDALRRNKHLPNKVTASEWNVASIKFDGACLWDALPLKIMQNPPIFPTHLTKQFSLLSRCCVYFFSESLISIFLTLWHQIHVTQYFRIIIFVKFVFVFLRSKLKSLPNNTTYQFFLFSFPQTRPPSCCDASGRQFSFGNNWFRTKDVLAVPSLC